MAHPKPFLGINCMEKKLKYNLAKLLERKKLSEGGRLVIDEF